MAPPNKPSDRTKLGGLKLKDTAQAKQQVRQYSRVVDRLRWILPLGLLAGFIFLIAWPMWQTNRMSIEMIDNVPNLMIEKLNLTGVDEKNQPYTLTAERALQAATAKNLVDLEKPRGEMTMTDGAWVSVLAQHGRLDQEAKKLWLGGAVEIFHDGGYRFTSEEMNVDMNISAAWSEKPVLLQGGFGEIRGNGFRLLEAGKTIVFTGPATARLDLRSGKGSGKENLNTSPSR